MKKKVFIVVYAIFVFLFIFNFKVNAQEKTCTKEIKNNLKQIAEQIDYETVLNAYVKEYSDIKKLPAGAMKDTYHYSLILYNVMEEFFVEVGENTKYYNEVKDGKLYFNNSFLAGGSNVKIRIYATYKTGCGGELIRVIKFRLPYYNVYSVYPECEGFQDKYKVCSKTSNTSAITNDEQFKAELEKEKRIYEEKHPAVETAIKKKEPFYISFKNWYLDNKDLTIPITISFIILVILIVIKTKRDNKSRIKVDLGDI